MSVRGHRPRLQIEKSLVVRITGCGPLCVQLFGLPSKDPCCRARARMSVPDEPMLVSMRQRSLPGAAQFLLPGNEWETFWLPTAISLLPARRHAASPHWFFPFSVEASPLRRVAPLKVRWRWPVLSTGLRVFLRGCDPSLREQIHQPESMGTSPRAYREPPFP